MLKLKLTSGKYDGLLLAALLAVAIAIVNYYASLPMSHETKWGFYRPINITSPMPYNSATKSGRLR